MHATVALVGGCLRSTCWACGTMSTNIRGILRSSCGTKLTSEFTIQTLYNQPSHATEGGIKESDGLRVPTNIVRHYMRCPLDSKLIFQNKIQKISIKLGNLDYVYIQIQAAFLKIRNLVLTVLPKIQIFWNIKLCQLVQLPKPRRITEPSSSRAQSTRGGDFLNLKKMSLWTLKPSVYICQ